MSIIGIIFLVIGLLFSGCAEKPRVVVVKKELPSWYLQPPHSNSIDLYALG